MSEALLLYAQFLKEFPRVPCEENPVLIFAPHDEYPVQISLVLNTGPASYDGNTHARFRYWFGVHVLTLRTCLASGVKSRSPRMVRAENFNGYWTTAVPEDPEGIPF